MNTKKYHVAQFGAFDVESMGDSLFPGGLQFGLSQCVECDIELFSMNECEKPYNGNSHVYSFSQFAARHALQPFDLMVLGGGEFLHFSPIKFTVNGVEKPYAGGYLFMEPIRMAGELGIPVVINCVGAPLDFTAAQQNELKRQLDGVPCVAARDEFSARRLMAAGVQNVHCVADNLWYLNKMYPKAETDALRRKLAKQIGRDLSTPYIVVQYGTTGKVEALAQQLKELKEKNGCRICLMAVNYCHEDRLGMQLLAQAGEGAFEVFDDYLQPPQMIAVISGAKAFVGTSLHGNLIAASYGVPFVGIDMYSSFVSKMDGIFSMIGCEEYLVPNEFGVGAALRARLSDTQRSAAVLERVNECQSGLDRHFERVATILREGT